MGTQTYFKPAGMSDDDVESDIDDFGQRVLIPKIRKQRSSTLLPKMDQKTAQSPMSSKKKKSLAYWRSQKEMPLVENPAFQRKNEHFFMKARQRNMGLDKMGDTSIQIKNDAVIECLIKKTGKINLSPNQDTIMLVNNTETFQKMLCDINEQQLIAVDIEGHMDHSYLGWIAIIQIATESAEYIIDPFEFTTEISEDLKEIFEDPRIVKIIFDAHMEINWFWKDYQIRLRGVIDCQVLYRNHYGLGNNSSLKTAVQMIFPGFVLQKGETTSDWRRRPLTSSQLKYAQLDVYTLLRMFQKMLHMVTDETIQDTIQESSAMTKKFDARRKYLDPFAELHAENVKLKKAGRSPLVIEEAYITKYQLMHQWRDRFAQMVDESPKYVLSLHALIQISASKADVNTDELWNIIKSCTNIPEKYIRPQCKFILKILTEVYANEVQMTAIVCHNCQNRSHPAVFCPFPKNKNAAKLYLKDNPAARAHQNRRRHLNVKKNRKLNKLNIKQ